jgi:predicted alpha/beta superfamily hydrolase
MVAAPLAQEQSARKDSVSGQSEASQPATAQQPAAAPVATGPADDILAHEHSVTDALEIVPFASKIFHNTRMLRILIPGNYWSPHNRMRRYPVLYLQDGQNLFDKATSFSHVEWQVDETIDHLVGSFQIPPMFIVGIDNAGEERTSEYLAYPDPHNPQFQSPSPPALRGTEYADFLIREVMPYIEKHYRVARGAANTAIGGSSYGADVSLTTVLNHPGVFGKVLLESPPLWIGDGQLLKDAEKTKQLPSQIYLGVGTNEFGNPEHDSEVVQLVTELESTLHEKGMGPTRLKLVTDQGAGHNEAAWARRLPDALLFLYGQKCLGTCR